jgi:hypothetical protein
MIVDSRIEVARGDCAGNDPEQSSQRAPGDALLQPGPDPRDLHLERIRKADDGTYVGTLANGELWNVPAVQSVAVPEGEALVNDTNIAAVMGIRSPVSVVVGQADDDMVRNRVTVLAEMRAAPIINVSGATAVVTPLWGPPAP